MTVDWKKKLIPNLPYLLFVYLFDKLCQAVRLAPGLDASEKFLHLSQGFTEAFSSGLPSLHPLDLLAGIAGAVIVRLAVYAKSKNTKKYRKGIEYGSARWGTAADIAPYVDPVPDWNIPLTQTEKLMFIVRYADDFRIFCRNREDAEKTMEAVTRWITERLKLEVSPEKTRIVNVRKRYSEFLGFKIMVYRKGEKYVVKSHICDKKLQLEESKLVEQAKRIAKPAQGRTQPDEIGLFDEMVLGIQNYYRIATCISLDCRKIHRRVMTVLTNRLNTETGCQLVREGGAMTDSEKERFGASQMVRYVSGINRPIYPIAFIKYKTAIGISAAVCCFSPAGRKKIHDNLEIDTTLFAYLREHLPEGHSLEYADCSLSLLSAQKGKCAISGERFLQPDSIVCHMKVPKEQGGQERYSNLVLLHRQYLPLLADQDAAALKSICKQLAVTRKQLTKINNLRIAAKLVAI